MKNQIMKKQVGTSPIITSHLPRQKSNDLLLEQWSMLFGRIVCLVDCHSSLIICWSRFVKLSTWEWFLWINKKEFAVFTANKQLYFIMYFMKLTIRKKVSFVQEVIYQINDKLHIISKVINITESVRRPV